MKKKTILNLCLGVTSIGVGAYHGFCDAKKIPVLPEDLELVLVFGPAIVRGTVGTVMGGFGGAKFARAIVKKSLDSEVNISVTKDNQSIGHYESQLREIIGKNAEEKMIMGVEYDCKKMGRLAGGTIGVVKGGVQTLIGYGLGYLTGKILE
ncbi:MAG: hypothetical protein PHQ66_01085 [Candidatus Nanoarchaeia archaeon]|nr:hypothetical protein [Candidatus Nanoarchaeia archaeon]MDD5358027.1 hypothetical protein [Candidatus Nanoarchaeia archaeon]MDD5588946.1 hypothetical protein [Candidatus Nanoarchaeia archaeon]